MKSNTSYDTWEDSATYRQFVLGTLQYVRNNYERTHFDYTFLTDTKQDLIICFANLKVTDAAIIMMFALVWTLLRHLATKHIFKPIGRRYQLSEKVCETKLPESAWKFCFYLISWTSVAYILILTDENKYLVRPSSIIDDYSMDIDVPMNIYAVYVLVTGFYVHSVYATVFLDQWRRDTIVMIVHHIVTIIALIATLSFKYYRSGIITIFLHDICDLLLEVCKLLIYFTSFAIQRLQFADIVLKSCFRYWPIARFASKPAIYFNQLYYWIRILTEYWSNGCYLS